MDLESDTKEKSIQTLLTYKEMAKNPDNHPAMIKDRTVLIFLAYVLDSADADVLEASLDTIELLCQSSINRANIKRTFGVLQSLQSLALNENVNGALRERAKAIVDLTVATNGQTVNAKGDHALKNAKTLTLHVMGLHEETRKDLEDILMKKVKGVHSVVVDVEHQRCVITALEQLEPKTLALMISEGTNMEARLVSKNKLNQEIFVPLTEESTNINLEELPPYLDEKESPVKEKAVRSMKDIRITASEWFSVAAGILQKSLYW